MFKVDQQEKLVSSADWVIRAKFIMCASFMTIFTCAQFFGLLDFPLVFFGAVLAFEAAINIPHHAIMRGVKSPERVFMVSLTLDIVAITLAAYPLGDLGKLLALLMYPIVFIFAGVATRPDATYFFANLGVVLLSVLTILEHNGIIPVLTPMRINLSVIHEALIILIVLPIYNFMAYFVAYMSGTIQKREDQLIHSVFHDELTGLATRELLMERLHQAMARAESVEGGDRTPYRFALLFIDLDRFKMINDGFGHAMGDLVLVEAARRLERCVKSVDTVAYLGGDEFTLLLEDIQDENAPSRVAERIQEDFAQPFKLQEQEVFSSASIGIALSSSGYKLAEEILRDAHTAMYRAKSEGKARFEVFDEKMRPRVIARLQTESELRRAIERNEFCLFYQPIMDMTTDHLAGFEALIRWRHPSRGIVLPDEFIPVAEETGLIVPIGNWVIRAACLELGRWRDKYKDRSKISVSVNLSAEQFKHEHMNGHIQKVLKETNVSAELLKFEITESVLIENPESAGAEISRLRAQNIQLYMDDFGTGYSSLSYLRRFSVDKLKIDRAFVQRIEHSGKDLEIARNIISLAHSLDMGVIAEGVETIGQYKLLKELDCDFVQGFYIAKPMDAAAADHFIESRVKP